MRNFALLLAFALMGTLGAPLAAPAAVLPYSPQPVLPLVSAEEGEDATGDAEDSDEDEDEEDEPPEMGCEIEDEEDVQLCAEIAREEREYAEAERCVLESASASVRANPGSGKVRLTVRYTTYAPAPFSLRYSSRGSKGGLHLGTAKAQFGRAGVFHDVVRLNDRKMSKLLAAREFQIELHALQTPGHCGERLTVQRRGAGRPHWS